MTILTAELIREMSEESLPDILPEADTWQLTMVGKIFLGALALSVLDRPTGYQVRGTLKEIEAVKDAVLSSKKFRCELTEPNATVESVIALLASKKDATQNFENILGVPWPM